MGKLSKTLRAWINTEENIKSFIIDKLAVSDVNLFVQMEDDKLRNLVEKYVFSKLISKKTWDVLVENDLIDWKEITLNGTCDYMSVNKFYVEKLLFRIAEYQAVMLEIKKNYIEEERKYKEKCNEWQVSINQLGEEISQLGIFSFRKKKLLKEELEKKKYGLSVYTKDHRPSLKWV